MTGHSEGSSGTEECNADEDLSLGSHVVDCWHTSNGTRVEWMVAKRPATVGSESEQSDDARWAALSCSLYVRERGDRIHVTSVTHPTE